jgi:zinc transporter ZupT
MSGSFLQLLLFGLAAGAANVLGGLILFPSGVHSRLRRVLKYVLALGAGFMLSVVFVDVLPKIIELWTAGRTSPEAHHLLIPFALVLGGYLLTQFFEHTIAPHIHLGEEVSPTQLIPARSAYTAVAGLLIHTFFDGVSIAAATQVDAKIGILVFLAILIHKLPEGFTLASLIIAAGKGRREALIATSIVGLTTFAGVMLYHFVGSSDRIPVAYALPVASGVTLYVAASDLVPEVNHHGGKNPFVSLSIFAGVALFAALHFLLHEIIGG